MGKLAVTLSLSALLWGLGCTPSPDKVCKKFEQLETKSASGPSSRTTPPPLASTPTRSQDHKACVKEMTRLKTSQPKAYKCVTRCTEQDNIDAAMLCTFGCMLKHTPKGDSLARRTS